MNDEIEIDAGRVHDAKQEFALIAAQRYRDLVAETMASAVEHGHVSPHGCIAVLVEVAAIVSAAKLGTNEGAALLELMAHQCAEAMKRPRPLTN